MAVGDTQIVQWVNISYTVCSEDLLPTLAAPRLRATHLWSALGGTCCANNNDGDIIAQWDVAAHRWLLTQNVFVSPYGVCVAISTSSDANGQLLTCISSRCWPAASRITRSGASGPTTTAKPGTTLDLAAAASKARFSAPITAPSCWLAITGRADLPPVLQHRRQHPAGRP